MASRRITACHTILETAWHRAETKWLELYPNEPKPFLTCTYRSNEEQNQLYSQGRVTRGIKVTNARGGESPHNFEPCFAFDIAFITLNKKLDWSEVLFRKFAEIIKGIDKKVEWGGDWERFRDNPHFQLKDWKVYKNQP